MTEWETDGRIELRDGRDLAYAEYGVPDGDPVLFFHGTPGSRFGAQLLADAATERGIRLVAPDRPGQGASTYRPRRAITDWVADVGELTETLGIERFGVVGFSGGGAYVLACAWAIPDRLTGAVVVSGVAPPRAPMTGIHPSNRVKTWLLRSVPSLVAIPVRLSTLVAVRDADRFASLMAADSSEADQAVLSRPGIAEIVRNEFVEAVRQGVRGIADELVLFERPWGFTFDAIPMAIALFHGEQDVNVPPTMGRYLAGAVPRCRSTIYPTEGHLSTLVNHTEAILRAAVEE